MLLVKIIQQYIRNKSLYFLPVFNLVLTIIDEKVNKNKINGSPEPQKSHKTSKR